MPQQPIFPGVPQGASPAGLTSYQQMIYDAFSTSTIIRTALDVQHIPVWDTLHLAAGATINAQTSHFFENVLAQSGKSIAQTNMPDAKSFPTPQAYSIFAVRIFVQSDILLADLVNIMSNLCFNLKIGDKIYQQAPIWYLPGGGGISGYDSTASTSILINGWPYRENMGKLALPIVIENTQTFYGYLDGTLVNGNPVQLAAASPTGGTGLTMTVLLDGLWAREIR